MHEFSVEIHSKYCFSRQVAPPGKVKITSSGTSGLKSSHRLIHWLNCGEQASDCAKIDPVGVTAT